MRWLRNPGPAPLSGTFQDGIADLLRFQRAFEGGLGRNTSREARQKVGDLVHEGMLVANLKSGHPPFVHIRMVSAVVGCVNRSPAPEFSRVLVVKICEPMEIVEIPLE